MDIELVSETDEELKFEIVFEESSFTTEEDVYEIKFPTSPMSPPFVVEKKNKNDQGAEMKHISTTITQACSSILNTSDYVVNGEEEDLGEERFGNEDKATQVHIENKDKALQVHIRNTKDNATQAQIGKMDTATQVHINPNREVVSLKLENIRLKHMLQLEAGKLYPHNCKAEKTEHKFDWLKQDEEKFHFFTGNLCYFSFI
jgi:hypothetical protein